LGRVRTCDPRDPRVRGGSKTEYKYFQICCHNFDEWKQICLKCGNVILKCKRVRSLRTHLVNIHAVQSFACISRRHRCELNYVTLLNETAVILIISYSVAR
jgi:hypothetical protein